MGAILLFVAFCGVLALGAFVEDKTSRAAREDWHDDEGSSPWFC